MIELIVAIVSILITLVICSVTINFVNDYTESYREENDDNGRQ